MSNPSVFIAIPSGSEWKADFGMSLAGLMGALGKPLKGGDHIERIQLWNTKGSILSRSREMLVDRAIDHECSHILFLDSDMVFPNWTLHRLLEHNKAVVAANCAVKTIPSNPTARKESTCNFAGDGIYSSDGIGIEKVWRVGTGVMLIKTLVFDTIAKPRFPITWNETNQDYTGEDWGFCEKLQTAGIPIWVDHTLSRHIGHTGSYEYGHKDIV